MVQIDCSFPRDEAIPAVVVMGITLIPAFALVVYFIAHIRPNNGSNKKALDCSTAIAKLGGVVIFFYFTAMIMFFISCNIDLYNCYNGRTMRVAAYGFHLIAYNLLLILFSYRFIKTFEDSPYQIGRYSKLVMKIIIPLPVIMIILIAMLLFIDVASFEFASSVGVISIVATFIVSLFVLFIFIKKLNIVIQDFVKQFGSISAPQLEKLNKSLRYVSIIYVMNRHSEIQML